MPGLMELLAALETAQIPKAIATSSDRFLAEACLGRFQLQDRFAFVLASEDVDQGKPDPEIYRTAAARLDLEPSRTLVLEDSENGCKAAAAAGSFAVAVPAEHSRRHDFSPASLVIDSLADPRLYETLRIDRP